MSSIENEYRQQQGEDYQEYLEFKEKRDRKKGILPEGYPIGDTLHPKTVKSYAKLGLDTPDSVYYASRTSHSLDKTNYLPFFRFRE
jgi:hypothetical protein